MDAKEWSDYIQSSARSSTWTFLGLNAKQSVEVADAIDALLAENAKLKEMAKRLEYPVPAEHVHNRARMCAICRGINRIDIGHEAYCELAALLNKGGE